MLELDLYPPVGQPVVCRLKCPRCRRAWNVLRQLARHNLQYHLDTGCLGGKRKSRG